MGAIEMQDLVITGDFLFRLGATLFMPFAILWLWQLQRRIDRLEKRGN